ncbi:hypothetical protein [Nitrobacter vulgaris]|nr:hypothetical protein [Nitrobacter vulgaris]
MNTHQEPMLEPPNDLPAFVDLENANFFAVQRSGDDRVDFVTGEALANQALSYAKRHQSFELLSLCLYSIVTGGRCEFLEAGFLRRLAAAAHAGSLN